MLLKMEEIKLQLRLDDDFSDEDELLELVRKTSLTVSCMQPQMTGLRMILMGL